jgi:hypothetical protein
MEHEGKSGKDRRIIIVIIQFNSIHVYLRANLTARRPITKLSLVCRNNNKNLTVKNESLHNNNKILIIKNA